MSVERLKEIRSRLAQARAERKEALRNYKVAREYSRRLLEEIKSLRAEERSLRDAGIKLKEFKRLPAEVREARNLVSRLNSPEVARQVLELLRRYN